VLPLPISALKSSSPVLRNPANRNRAVPLTYDQFRYSFANAVSEEEAKQLYEDFAVPTPGKPLFQAATANLNPWTEAKVDTKNPDRGPLLLDRDREDSGHGHASSTAAGARSPTPRSRSSRASPNVRCGSLPDVDIPFDRRREQECQAQRPLWGQVQASPASVVAELNPVIGVALEPADDDNTISLTVLVTLVYQHSAKLRVALFHVLYLCANPGLGAR
jgi:hypothetical protein